MSRLADEINAIKKALNDIIAGAADALNSHSERVMDLVAALSKIAITPQVIKETKIGNLVANVKAKYSGNAAVAEAAKEVLLKWKKIIEGSGKKPSGSKEDKAAPRSGPSGSSYSLSAELRDKLTSLPAGRQNAIKLLTDSAKVGLQSTDVDKLAIAGIVGYKVEEEMDLMLDFGRNNKAYSAKLRTLMFNLKKNVALRERLLSGSLEPRDLVGMTSEQLATDELKSRRGQITSECIESRRADWLQEHLVGIRTDIGIDPHLEEWVYDSDDDSGIFDGLD